MNPARRTPRAVVVAATTVASLAAVTFAAAPVGGQDVPPGGVGDGPAIDLTFVGAAVPAVVHVRAAVPVDGDVSPLDTRYEWDFGDPAGKHNVLPGWNAAHVYDRPGQYTVTLTVRTAAGRVLKRTTFCRALPDDRRRVYTSADGDDRLDGGTPTRAVRTPARAVQLAGGGDAAVLFRRGDVFDVSASVNVSAKRLRIGNYPRGGTPGDGPAVDPSVGVQLKPPPGVVIPPKPAAPEEPLPVLRKVEGPPKQESIFVVARGCEDVLFDGVEFDSVWPLDGAYGEKKVPARALTVGGSNVAVRYCSFRNVTDGVNAELRPTGLLVQDCRFSNEIRGYGIYSTGADHAYVGNAMGHPQQEHHVRASEPGTTRLLVAHNAFARRNMYKGGVELRHASWFYVAANHLSRGTLRVGPQEQDKATPNWQDIKCEWGVVQDNRLDDLFLNVRLGTYHATFRNNVIRAPADSDWAVVVACDKPGYDDVRKVSDVRIEHNTVITDREKGQFLFVQGRPAGLTVRRNVFVAPHLKAGGNNAGIFATAADLDGFDAIEGNVFPPGPGGLHRVGRGAPPTREAWARDPRVKGERYAAVPVDADDNVPLGTDAGAWMGTDRREREREARESAGPKRAEGR